MLQNSKVVDFIMQGSNRRKGSLADVPEEVGSLLCPVPSGWKGGSGAWWVAQIGSYSSESGRTVFSLVSAA